MIRLAIADDHPIVLDGLEHLFRTEHDIEVVARCVNGTEAVDATRRHKPDVLLLDLRMPRAGGLEVARQLRREGLATRVVIVAAEVNDQEVVEALRSDVRGIVLKELAPALLVQCVRKVAAGERWIEKASLTKAMDAMLRREAGASDRGTLTPREIELIQLVAGGMRNKDVAVRLGISEGTVKMHLHHVYKKLNMDNRVSLTLYAQREGLV